jgi:hypothetical protein
MGIRRRVAGLTAALAALSAVAGVVLVGSASASGTRSQAGAAHNRTSLAVQAPLSAFAGHSNASTAACTLPDGSTVRYFHC